MKNAINYSSFLTRSILLFLVVILLTPFFNLYGQSREIDSLKHQLNIEKNDSVLIEINRVLTNRYFHINRDSSMIYISNALELAKKINNINLIAQTQAETGQLYLSNQETDLALEYALKAANNFNLVNNKDGLYELGMTTLGVIYSSLGDNTTANSYIQNAIDYYQSINNTDYESYGYIVLAQNYESQKQYLNALENYNLSIDIMLTLDYNSDPSIYRNIGTVYNALGNVHNKLGQFETALEYYDKALQIFTDLKQYRSITTNNISKSKVYYALKIYQSAIQYAKEAYSYARDKNDLSLLNNSSKELYASYLAIKDYENAFIFLQEYSHTRDTLNARARSKTVADLAAKYESDLKEKENAELKATNTLQTQRLKNKNILGIIITIFFAIAFIGIIFILRMLKKQKGLNRDIKISKEIAESANNKLQTKSEDLEKFNNVMLDREMRIIELKKEANKLAKSSNTDFPYPEVEEI